MKILIIGKSGMGKSNFADIIKNFIFKNDGDCEIIVDDTDRETKQVGQGKDIHTVKVRRPDMCLDRDVNECDILVQIKNDNFKKWFEKI